MKILVDAMCAEFGGIRTYVEHLLATWGRDHPEDELLVMVPSGSQLPTGTHRRIDVKVGRPTALARPWAQTRRIRGIIRQERPDAILATLPSTTLTKTGVPLWIVVYDLRHELEPSQFSLRQRIMRRVSYGNGYRIADGMISISQRSLDDLHHAHPRTRSTRSVVAHLGADHVLDWPPTAPLGHAIAFGHHSNKNVDLVIDGWHKMLQRNVVPPKLLVVGVSASQRPELVARLADLGLSEVTEVAAFMPEDEFRTAMASAGLVMFPSSFEGFGLPVVEGMLLGIPVVIGPERATVEVAGGHAVVLSEWTADAVADAVAEAVAITEEQRDAARRHAQAFTWRRNVEITRQALAGAAGR